MLYPIRQRLAQALARIHRDERGDEGVSKILIIAMIVIPLVIVLIAFGDRIVTFFQEQWTNLTGQEIDPGQFD
ncbi:MAG: hypothetical protein ACC662_11365 [Planctomycetota bacterium]